MSEKQQSQDAVWQDPTGYDVQKHGPPYLPTKLSHDKKAGIRAWAKTSAFYDVAPPPNPLQPMSHLLAFMQALALVHQTHHWQSRGGHFYGDHLLFGRLYEDSGPLIDQVAEKSVGVGSVDLVAAYHQVEEIGRLVQAIYGNPTDAPPPQTLVEVSLRAETAFLKFIADVLAMLERDGGLTHGISNLLEGVADKHEEFVYLLKQRADQSEYTYDRR